jgi:hypothetical protein
MAQAPNFSSILDESPTEVAAPQPMPQGTYVCVVQGVTYDKTTKKGTDYVEFTLRPVSAEADVDEEEVAGFGDFDSKTLRATFYLTEDAIYRLDEFHTHCGLDIENDGLSRRARNDECINVEVRVFVKHETSQDGSRIFARFNRSLPAK